MGVLSGINKEKYFEYFEELTRIPRGSGNEKGVSDFLVKFAKDLGLEVIQDEFLNVIIRKPGTPGYENSETVIIQGHMDMVNEKNNDTVHDFTKDPLKLKIEGDYIYADGTTLGADNGIAVAYAMAILSSRDIPHPPLEVLITTEEEVGLNGALGLNPDELKGTRLINIDSEEEGVLISGCAGGARVIHSLKHKYESPLGVQVKVTVTGLSGGHSGMDINKVKGNSIKILGRVLNTISETYPVNIVSCDGGSKMNAIPREAHAVISIDPSSKKQIEAICSKMADEIRKEINPLDSELKITCKLTDEAETQMDINSTSRLIRYMMMVPSGIMSLSPDIKNLVMTSTNIGVMETLGDEVDFQSCVRSSSGTSKQALMDELQVLAKTLGMTHSVTSDYPEWEYVRDSELRNTAVSTYKELTGKELKVDVIHAGLECGILSGKTKNCDMISIGPDLFDVHSPNEHMSIPSAERTFEFVKALLKNLK